MAIGKGERVEGARTLMSNQRPEDPKGMRNGKVAVTFWVDPEEKESWKAFAAENGMTLSDVCIKGADLYLDVYRHFAESAGKR